MERLHGYVSECDKSKKSFGVRLKKEAHPHHRLNGKEIPVEHVESGVSLKLFESVTFTVSNFSGYTRARDVRLAN